MNLKIQWKEVLTTIASAVGGILSILLFSITNNDLSFVLFPLFMIGGWILGLLIENIPYKDS